MRLFYLLADVLVMCVVSCYSNILMEGKVEAGIAMNRPVNHVQKRAEVKKWYNIHDTPICGRTLVTTMPYKREISGADDNLSDYINEDPDVSKILGGTYVTYGEIPWIATVIYNSNYHLCGAAIINEFWVISAAHCFYAFGNSSFQISVGDHRLYFQEDKEEIYNVNMVINHEQYHADEVDYDIALAKIEAGSNGHGIHFNNYVQPVCLPSSSENPPVGTQLLFSGWGHTIEGGWQSEILKKTTLPVIDYQTCTHIYPNSTSPNMFCAGYLNGDNDVCKGDGGGPAVYRTKEGFVLYGISVFSTGCFKPNQPSAFSSVPKYRDWILSTIRRNSNDVEKIMPVATSSFAN